MQVMAGSMGSRIPGLWDGFADKSLADVLELVSRFVQLPAFDLDRDGMVGDTSWLSIGSARGDSLLLYFTGAEYARFEWYPSQVEPGSGLHGFCKVEACSEAIRQMADNAPAGDYRAR